MNLNEFDYTFTDTELQEILGLIEQKAAIQEFATPQEFQNATGAPLPPPYGLQFQPHAAGQVAALNPAAGQPRMPIQGFGDAPVVATGYPVKPDPGDHPLQTFHTSISGLSPEAAAAFTLSESVVMMQPPSSAIGDPNCLSSPGSNAGIAPTNYYVGGPALTVLCPSTFPAGTAGPTGVTSFNKPSKAAPYIENKSSVNHSFVEKQRRDRINSLIDELRDLVPPQKNAPKGETADARRPKHVVLSDTVALLKSLQDKLKLDGLYSEAMEEEKPEQTNLGIKPEPLSPERVKAHSTETSCEKHDCHSDSQGDMEAGPSGRAPELPTIPVHLQQGPAGVSVEKGPDCHYVQVKCRDRRGLLSDIINALKTLPLEIRTAAVTTTQSGIVHDVFEVRADDEGLDAVEIEGAIHRALQHVDPDHSGGKRLRKSFDGPV